MKTLQVRLAKLGSWMFLPFRDGGLSYQTCRFCRRGIGIVSGLWKYGVRHYICDDCRVTALAKAIPSGEETVPGDTGTVAP